MGDVPRRDNHRDELSRTAMTSDHFHAFIPITPLSWQAVNFRTRREVLRTGASFLLSFAIGALLDDISHQAPLAIGMFVLLVDELPLQASALVECFRKKPDAHQTQGFEIGSRNIGKARGSRSGYPVSDPCSRGALRLKTPVPHAVPTQPPCRLRSPPAESPAHRRSGGTI